MRVNSGAMKELKYEIMVFAPIEVLALDCEGKLYKYKKSFFNSHFENLKSSLIR